MINVMFCILRNACAEQDQTFAIDQNVNIVLYEYQKRFAVDPQMGKKAFVYQTNNKIIVQDFGDVDKNSIFLAEACREHKDYCYCLSTAFATMNDFANDNPNDNNYLIILMQHPMKNSDTQFFLEYLVKNRQINHNVILIQCPNCADSNLCDFILSDINYSKKGFIKKIMTFEELYQNDGSGYDLC